MILTLPYQIILCEDNILVMLRLVKDRPAHMPSSMYTNSEGQKLREACFKAVELRRQPSVNKKTVKTNTFSALVYLFTTTTSHYIPRTQASSGRVSLFLI